MRLVPTLIGALIGAAVGIAVQVGLETYVGSELGWVALVIGLLVGLGARALAGDSIRQASYVRGAVVALVGLAAIVGGNYAASEVTRQRNVAQYESNSAVAAPPADPDGAVDDAPTDADPEASEAVADDADPAAAEDADDSAEATTIDAATADGSSDDAEAEQASGAKELNDMLGSEEATEVVTDENIETAAARPAPADASTAQLPEPRKIPTSPWTFAFFALGTFMAYELARGGGKQKHPEDSAA